MIVKMKGGSIFLSLHTSAQRAETGILELPGRVLDRKRGKRRHAGPKDRLTCLVESGTRSREQLDGG